MIDSKLSKAEQLRLRRKQQVRDLEMSDVHERHHTATSVIRKRTAKELQAPREQGSKEKPPGRRKD